MLVSKNLGGLFMKLSQKLIYTFLFISIITTFNMAQTDKNKANEYYNNQNWEEAVKAYSAITEEEPENSQAWFRLGSSYFNLEKYSKALPALETANEKGFFPFFVRYQIASAYSLLNENEKAMDWLSKAVEAGYSNVNQITTDTNFDKYRNDPKFEELVTGAKKNATPCEYDDNYRKFDFWIGEWDVFNYQNPNGPQQGTNIITKINGGCALYEDWTSATGNKGSSINYYNPATKKWRQVWTATGGYVIDYEGDFVDGAMRLVGDLISIDGSKTDFRGTWTPLEDGNVRQFFETSSDGGETWVPWFDGLYVKKK